MKTIESYIAGNNPDAVDNLLARLNAPTPINPRHREHLLHKATEKYPEEVFAEMATMDTPYYNLIMQYAQKENKTQKHSNCSGSSYSNCGGGCSGCSGASNTDGNPNSGGDQVSKTETTTKETIVEKIKDLPQKASTFIN